MNNFLVNFCVSLKIDLQSYALQTTFIYSFIHIRLLPNVKTQARAHYKPNVQWIYEFKCQYVYIHYMSLFRKTADNQKRLKRTSYY